MDKKVLFNISSGLYVIGTFDGCRPVGCIINTCFQVTSQNPILAVSLNKNNYTLKAIHDSKRFSLSIIAEDTNPAIIGTFGFCSSRDNEKYDAFGYEPVNGVPFVSGRFAGRLVLEAINFVDNETHEVVFARLVDTVPGIGKQMTYDYYHSVIKGKAPKNAPSYVEEEDKTPAANATAEGGKQKYRCAICGYEVEVEGELPDDYRCPLCKADKTKFTKQ